MFTLILLLYLQQNLDVTLESVGLHGQFADKAACEQAATNLRGALPTPQGYAAAWHDALCLPIARDVTVNASAPAAAGALMPPPEPAACGADGAWRRMAALCAQPSLSPSAPSAPP